MDITGWVGGAEARDELDSLSVELSFTIQRNRIYDRYMTWPGASPGDGIKVINHGLEVFSGIILSVGLDGSVTANDPGWYLTKSQIVLQVDNAAAEDAIRRMCAKAQLPLGALPSLPARISQVWTGDTPETILQDILAVCSAETGKRYKRRVRGGALTITELPQTPLTAYYKPASNLAAFDLTWATGAVTGRDSMEDLVNSVILTGDGQDGARVLGRAYNPDSIARYGLLQQTEELSGDENTAQARQRVRTLLEQGDRLTIEREIAQLWGADEVESGVLLRFPENGFGVTGLWRVTGVTHQYGPPHLMHIVLQNPESPRAAGSGDRVEV